MNTTTPTTTTPAAPGMLGALATLQATPPAPAPWGLAEAKIQARTPATPPAASFFAHRY